MGGLYNYIVVPVHAGNYYVVIIIFSCRPLIQNKLSVLSQAGLAKNDFSEAESSVVTAKVSHIIIIQA